jgi:hypothetical protein
VTWIVSIEAQALGETAFAGKAIMKNQNSRSIGIRNALPVMGIFAGASVHSNLPRGTFGASDMVIRAAITAAVAGGTALILFWVFRPPVQESAVNDY